ncbi:MAG: gliding motility-associated C-terminal domain-containing protein [Vicingaceae bacterium]|nr:gliding motility-associated C-terminal domain-containing protein [Vicingaceae bacterium]
MKKFLLFITILFSGITSSYASHLMGAEITYTHVSGDDYEVTLIIYRDCSGITVSTNQNVTFESASCNQNINFNIPFIQTVDVSQVCPGQTTTCNGGTVPGTQQYVFRGIVTLTPCVDWIMHWNSGTRNPAITNLVAPSTENLYIQNTLNNVIGTNNNSPQFFAIPTPYICVNQLTIYNHAATDADGDSLYYSLSTPLTTPGPPGAPIAFTAGYSQAQPIITNPVSSLNFNQLTGEMCFVPGQNQISVVSVLIEEFRNNVLIGSQIREMQIVVSATCSSNSNPSAGVTPTCSGGGGGMNIQFTSGSVTKVDTNSVTMCPNDTVCVSYAFSDPDADNVTVDTNSISAALPGCAINLTGDGTPTPTLTVCWVPSVLDTGLNVFSVILTDDACPISGLQTFSYDITVLDEVYAGLDTTICNLGSGAQLGASGGAGYTWYEFGSTTPVPVSAEFTCNPCFNPVATPTVTTDYYVVSTLVGQCKDKDTVRVTVSPNTIPAITNLPDTFFCEGSSVNVSADAGYISYDWTTTGGTTQTENFNQGGLFAVIVSDGICIDTLHFVNIIEIPNPHPVISGNLTFCLNDGTTLSTEPVYDSYNWTSGSTFDSTNIVATLPGISSITLTVDSLGCTTSVTEQLTALAVPSTVIIADNDTICPGGSTNLSTLGSFDSYVWSPSGSTDSTTASPSGLVSVTISENGCDYTANSTIFTYPNPVAEFTINPEGSGEPNIDITFTDASTGASSWLWNFDVTNIGTNPPTRTGQGPFIHIYDNQGAYTVTLNTTNDYGCANSITKEYLVFSEIGTPNVITPNGDGKNDFLVFENLDPDLFPNKITILNRWGRKVFEQEFYDNMWSGDDLSAGTYFYVLNVDFNSGQEVYKGTLTILK